MIFGPTRLIEAEGAILAHSLRLGDLNFKKGRRLSKEDVSALAAAGHEEVTAARLESSDVHEDEAAERLATALAGPLTSISAAFTGRCNLIAETRGICVVDEERLNRINRVHESLTLATLSAFEPVEPRQMLATVKIIPFAAPRAALESCLAIAAEAGPLVSAAAFRPIEVGLVQTTLPGIKPAILDKTKAALDSRLAAVGAPPARELRCAHDPEAVAQSLQVLRRHSLDLLLVSGASAIVDRRDVVPAGIVDAGGEIDHFGMPVDPGNLLLLAHHEEVPVIGLPGCARSPKINGFDWVLQRLAAGLEVSPQDITVMGVGGLLKEIGARPLSRAEAVSGRSESGAPRAPRIGAVVLAAGQSRRMGKTNKLLAEVDGEPMLRHAVRAAQASQVSETVVVTGHEANRIESALSGLGAKTVHNPDYAQGLSTSLHRGLAALPEEMDGAVILLGDMPKIDERVIDKLIAAFNPVEGRAICLPSFGGKRGNPMLFARRFFAEVQEIAGDVGARQLIGTYPELVAEVPMETDAALIDVDTPAALGQITAAKAQKD